MAGWNALQCGRMRRDRLIGEDGVRPRFQLSRADAQVHSRRVGTVPCGYEGGFVQPGISRVPPA